MRLAFVSAYYKPAYIYGGPTQSISSLCEALARLGVAVTVFTTDANGPGRLSVPLAKPVPVEGVTVWYFPLALNGSFFYSPALAATCRKRMGDFDLSVLEGLWAHAMAPAAAACRKARIPYVHPLRGQLQPWALKQKQWKKRLFLALRGRRCLDGAAALHCTDAREAEAAAPLGLKAPCIVVPNGLDVSRFANLPGRGALRRRLGIPDHAILLLFLGRLHRQKRPDIAVAALAAAQTLPTEVHLGLVGPDEGSLTPSLLAQAEDLGCPARLHCLGLMEGTDILQALADADLLLMPSDHQESFGRAALEAMAAGVPILVSEGVPVGRWAEAAGAGRMVPCSAEAFAEAVRDLLAKPELLESMGQKGRTLVKERFDIRVVASQMLAQFEAIINTGKPMLENG